jgi:hypothetical protein
MMKLGLGISLQLLANKMSRSAANHNNYSHVSE